MKKMYTRRKSTKKLGGFKKINTIDKLLARLFIKRKKEIINYQYQE